MQAQFVELIDGAAISRPPLAGHRQSRRINPVGAADRFDPYPVRIGFSASRCSMM
jgi:hypothetical protein